jgi:hypothetical protein
MDVAELTHVGRVVVAASPQRLYDLVSDVTRMGDWSPVCKECWWDEGAGPVVGAWFTGRNVLPERTWEGRCEVVAAVPGQEFAWVVGGVERGTVYWCYRFTPVASGTEVSEHWQVRWVHPGMGRTDEELAAMKARTLAGIAETLANLKQAAETEAP